MPSGCGVGGSVEVNRLLVGDGGEQAFGIAGRNGNVGLDDSFRESAAELVPGRAAIRGLEDAATSAIPTSVFPRAFAGLPQCGIDRIWIRRIDDDSTGTDVVALGKDLLKGLSTVG